MVEYISNLVEVFRATPLEPWGSIWVNIGDKRGKQGNCWAFRSDLSLPWATPDFIGSIT